MNKSDISKVLEKIESASGYIENLAGSALDVLVIGTRVEGIIGLVVVVLLAIASIGITKYIISNVAEYDREDATIIAMFINGCIGLILLLLAYDHAIKIFAPEYSILKALLN